MSKTSRQRPHKIIRLITSLGSGIFNASNVLSIVGALAFIVGWLISVETRFTADAASVDKVAIVANNNGEAIQQIHGDLGDIKVTVHDIQRTMNELLLKNRGKNNDDK